MINIPASLKDIGQLADVLNQFKSEAVQVKLLDRLLSAAGSVVQPVAKFAAGVVAPKRRGRPPGSKNQKRAASVASPVETAPRRKPGRPPKAASQASVGPRRVGRPPKAGRPAAQEAPKRRGRPP